ncbi:MAG: amino acid transporter, partial [Hymenobacteraceae bacterium]|nr:amino acid transporter [Hymenobacteraceae bacterium]
TMSRDGLLPGAFSRIHPKHKTPYFATIVTGVVVAVPALFMNLTEVTDLTSIGTLFAFVLVCGGILLLEEKQKMATATHKGFRVPYINGKYVLPLLILVAVVLLFRYNAAETAAFFSMSGGWESFQHKIPLLGFIGVTVVLTVLTFLRNLSLIPVLGLLTNLYLMTELGITNWSRFLAWLAFGLVIYFAYGYRNSKLHNTPPPMEV